MTRPRFCLVLLATLLSTVNLAFPQAQGVTFAVIGDYGSTAVNASDAKTELQVANLVKSWQPDFIVTVGDNNYECGGADTIVQNIGQYYCDYIANPDAPHAPPGQVCSGTSATAKLNRFFPALGNHDWYAPNAKSYLDYFSGLPGNKRYYDVRQGPVHLFALDSQGKQACETSKACPNMTCTYEPDGTDANSKQAKWLKKALAASDAPWKLVFFHHPPYSCSAKSTALWMRWPFEKWGVNAVLAGHRHVYERIVQKRSPNFPYFINGAGGIDLTDCKAKDIAKNLPSSQFDAVDITGHNGAMKIVASAQQITFTFITTDGSPGDTCTLTKSGRSQKLQCSKSG